MSYWTTRTANVEHLKRIMLRELVALGYDTPDKVRELAARLKKEKSTQLER